MFTIKSSSRTVVSSLVLTALIATGSAGSAYAASAGEIDREVDRALDAFQKIEGAKAFLQASEGALIFPKVYKAGIGIGGNTARVRCG